MDDEKEHNEREKRTWFKKKKKVAVSRGKERKKVKMRGPPQERVRKKKARTPRK